MSGDFDLSKFLKGINLADKAVQQAAQRGAAKVLADVERKAKEACPVDQSGRKPGGTLQATIKAHVGDIKVSSNGITGKITAGGGEAADYAVKQHEEVLTHSKPTSGQYASKYIEKPLKDSSGKAGQVIATEIKSALRS